MAIATAPNRSVRETIDLVLPLFLVALLIALCAQLLRPFVGLLLWTIILAICFNPVQEKLLARGWSPGRAATLLGCILFLIVVVPTAIGALNAASNIPRLVGGILGGRIDVAPPPTGLLEIPLVGPKAHALWADAARDLPAFVKEYSALFRDVAIWLLKHAGGMVVTMAIFLGAIALAAVSLAYAAELKRLFTQIFARVAGDSERGEHLVDVIGATVRSVGVGVIGVAFFQAVMCGIGFFVVGLPGAGLLFLLALVFSIIHLPVMLITLPAILYVFATETTGIAIAFAAWSIFAGFSDAPLKPLLIGRGLDVPMPVILLGVIGGVIAFGLVGLFIGAVILAVGYVLFLEWLDRPLAAA